MKRLVKFENLEEKMSKWTGFFCLFSADLWKFERKKIEKLKKLYRSDAISEEKEGKKQGN